MNNLSSNTNLLSTANFKLLINSAEFSHTEYFAVTANIPSVSLAEASSSFKNMAGYVPGDKLVYDPFSIRIQIDEDLNGYKEIFNWMLHNTQSASLKMSDISLLVMSSHGNVNQTFRFINAFPTNLGQIDFNVQSSDIEYAATDVTFRYDYFKIVDASDTGFSC